MFLLEETQKFGKSEEYSAQFLYFIWQQHRKLSNHEMVKMWTSIIQGPIFKTCCLNALFVLLFFLSFFSVKGLQKIFPDTFPEEFNGYDFCERLTVTLTNYTLKDTAKLSQFYRQDFVKPLYKDAEKSDFCYMMGQILKSCFKGYDSSISNEMCYCNAAYFQNYNCEVTWSNDKKEILKNVRCFRTILTCPPLVIDLAFHEHQSFQGLPKLPQISRSTHCSELNYALRITDITEYDCPAANSKFLYEWLEHVTYIKLLEIHNWGCSDIYTIELFNHLFHNKLQFLRITQADTFDVFIILSMRLLQMEDLVYLQAEYSAGCYMEIQLPQQVKAISLKGFNLLKQVPPQLKYLSFRGSLDGYNVTWYTPESLVYMALHITMTENATFTLNFPTNIKLTKITLVLHRLQKHKESIYWMYLQFPLLRKLRIEIYDDNGSGMFDTNDLKNLLKLIRQGHFPNLRELRLRNAQLRDSMETIVQIVAESKIEVINLENTHLSESDGKLLHHFFRNGSVPVFEYAYWYLADNQELHSIGHELFMSAHSHGITLYGIPYVGNWMGTLITLANDDDDDEF